MSNKRRASTELERTPKLSKLDTKPLCLDELNFSLSLWELESNDEGSANISLNSEHDELDVEEETDQSSENDNSLNSEHDELDVEEETDQGSIDISLDSEHDELDVEEETDQGSIDISLDSEHDELDVEEETDQGSENDNSLDSEHDELDVEEETDQGSIDISLDSEHDELDVEEETDQGSENDNSLDSEHDELDVEEETDQGSENDNSRDENEMAALLSDNRININNHLPLTIYDNVPLNPVSQCFIGFYTADGLNSRDNRITGIGLRSTDAPFLFNLLKACGVKKPNLRFRAASKSKLVKGYNAGIRGHVVWKFKSKKVVEARLKFGLPSSNIKDTDIPKAKQFFKSLDKLSLLRFVLFYAAGDGTVCSTPTTKARPGELVKLLSGITLCSRDEHIFPLIKEALGRYGLDHSCSISEKQLGGVCIMRIHLTKKHDGMIEAMLEAMTTIPEDIMHPKLKLLQNHLNSRDLCSPLEEYSTRSSFYSYLQNDMNDKLLWVLGQDFHVLNLHSINAWLSFGGFPTVETTQDLQLKRFKQHALKLKPSTPQQAVLADYIDTCKRRVLPSGKPIDVLPNQHQYYCDYEGCSYIATTTDILNTHKQTHDRNRKKYACDFKDCQYSTVREWNLKEHKKSHAPDFKPYACSFPGCGFTTNVNVGVVKRHEEIVHYDKNRKVYACKLPGCSYTTLVDKRFKAHEEAHKANKTCACDFPGCSYIAKQLCQVKAHKLTHDPEAKKKYSCSFPGCSFTSSNNNTVKRHMKFKHKELADGKPAPHNK